MHKIIINGRFLTQPVTGVQRVAIEAIKAIDDMLHSGEINPNHYKFVLYTPRTNELSASFRHIDIVQIGRLSGHLWEQLELPFHAIGKPLVNLCGPAPLMKLKQIVAIHDAAVYANKHNFSLLFRSWYKLMFMSYRLTSKKVITVSQFSRSEIVKYCGMKDSKLAVYHLGVDHFRRIESDASILDRYDLTKGNYVLAVSSRSPNKNFESVVRAIEHLGYQQFDCVVVGGGNNQVFKASDSLGAERPNSNVKLLGYVSDGELKALYENAGCFVYPSFYEGFGLPPVEAMSCGCPVIVSEAASMPEVCGGNAYYCNPHEYTDIAAKIKLVMEDETLRAELAATGAAHSSNYRWKNFAKGLHAEIAKMS